LERHAQLTFVAVPKIAHSVVRAVSFAGTSRDFPLGVGAGPVIAFLLGGAI
jgi:hypothetical protein